MSAVLLEGTQATYLVDSARLRCTLSTAGCGFNSESAKHSAGDWCPKCGTVKGGQLEREKYQVDLRANGLVGQCGCERFRFFHGPKIVGQSVGSLKSMPADTRKTFRCKHIHEARDQAKIDNDLATCEELDEWLTRQPEQKQEGP